MSEAIPKFVHGERMQAMCTSENKAKGIYAVCGVVLSNIRGDKYHCFLESGRFVEMDGCSMSHVDEDMYQGWKENGIDTSNPESVEVVS